MDQPLANKVTIKSGADPSIALDYVRAGAAICASARTREEIDATARAIG